MEIVVIAHNIRSTHNVGAILRTSEGFGVDAVYTTGYTPYPAQTDDVRLPHLRDRLTRQIHKTALGAETLVRTEYWPDVHQLVGILRAKGFYIIGLEQSPNAVPLPQLRPPHKCALLLGEEVEGITPKLIALCDTITEIPMKGRKESFNVSVATGIALYELSKNS